MLAILSVPAIMLAALFAGNAPPAVQLFRLRLGFGAMFVLGALVYSKLNLLANELVRLVRLTHDSIGKPQLRSAAGFPFAKTGRTRTPGGGCRPRDQ